MPNPALAALNPTVAVDAPVYDSTISDLPSFDLWEMGSTWIRPLAFDTPLNIQFSDTVFAQLQFVAAAEGPEGEDEEEYIGNELIYYIDSLAKTRETERRRADPNYDEDADFMKTAKKNGWNMDDDDDACAGAPSGNGNDDDGTCWRDREAELEEDEDDY